MTGGRDYRDEDAIETALLALTAEGFWDLAHGGALGTDTLAGIVAERLGMTVTVYPANWAAHGRAAGPIRNRKMLEEFRPAIVLAFPGGAGTANCVKTARELGILVKVIA